MTTFKERFAEKFASYFNALDRQDNTTVNVVVSGEIISFFQQELLALAEEVESLTKDPSRTITSYGLRDAAILIRSKADELL